MSKGTVVLTAVAMCVVSSAFSGSLTPPGAPAGTMKTLQEVYDKADEAEARTPISSIPYTISQSGSYYLTQDLGPAAQNTNGITVGASEVTIDLNGFKLEGAGYSAGTTGTGIYASSSLLNVAVRNGTILYWRLDGIGPKGSSSFRNCQFENLRCYYNGNDGIGVGPNCTVVNNVCYYNGGRGINVYVNAVIAENACYHNDSDGIYGNGSVVTHNTCHWNGGKGIDGGDQALVQGNRSCYNEGDGIRATSDCMVTDNVCTMNGLGESDGAGIHATNYNNVIERNLVTTNDRGIDVDLGGNYIASNRASNNTTDYDIHASSTKGQIIDSTSGGDIVTTDPYANFRF